MPRDVDPFEEFKKKKELEKLKRFTIKKKQEDRKKGNERNKEIHRQAEETGEKLSIPVDGEKEKPPPEKIIPKKNLMQKMRTPPTSDEMEKYESDKSGEKKPRSSATRHIDPFEDFRTKKKLEEMQKSMKKDRQERRRKKTQKDTFDGFHISSFFKPDSKKKKGGKKPRK